MTPLNHTQARQWIERAADGLLTPAQQKELDAHLKGCAECRAYAAQLQQLEGALRAALVTNLGQSSLPSSSVDKIVEALQKQTPKGGGSRGGPRAGWPRIFGILLAVSLGALALFYGRSLLSSNPATAPEDSPVVAAATATSTPTQSVTDTPTLTPAPVELVLVAVPNQNVNCREGNSSQFEIADTLFEGETYTPNARGHDNLWVRFTGPVTQVQCWVFVDNLALLVNEDVFLLPDVPEALLPYAAYPPTPTPSPTPTFTPEPTETPVVVPECSDGIDNDKDGQIDLKDRQCRNASDNHEDR